MPATSRSDRFWAGVALAIVLVVLVPAAAWAGFRDDAAASQSVSTGALEAPTGLAAGHGLCVPAISTSIRLTWTAPPATKADGYVVERSSSAAGPFTEVATVSGAATTSYDSPTLPFSTTFHYRVLARKFTWRSAPTPVVAITTRSVLCL